jgi:serine protease AprX
VTSFILASLSYAGIYKSNNITAQGLDIKKYINLENSKLKNYKGNNVNVAIIDSGIYQNTDIRSNRIIFFKDFTTNISKPYDDNGHGTFVAGIIGANGKLKGIAPKVNFIILKVLDSFGKTDTNTLLSALNWVYNNSDLYKIKVVNMSIGVVSYLNYKNDPICKLIKKISDKGVIIVCSAGNINDADGASILSPGISPDVITVGSIKTNRTYNISDSKITTFSAHGKVFEGYTKPDLVTLGVDILSLDYKKNNSYITRSGTSFSCAIITGVVALLCEKYPNKSFNYIKKYILENTIKLKRDTTINQGNGEFFIKQ